jgi:hypothetical protein
MGNGRLFHFHVVCGSRGNGWGQYWTIIGGYSEEWPRETASCDSFRQLPLSVVSTIVFFDTES